MDNLQQIQPTDRQLIEAAANGDADAFREIVEQHQAMVYRTCFRILRDVANAEDAAQATFIVLHRKSSQLHRETVLGGWLYRTAELVCREFLRSSARRKHHEESAAAAMHETASQDPMQVWNTIQPELDLALMTLPQKYRDVVVLRFLEEKSTNETATVMGISASAVTTRLARGMELLRDWFQRRGIVLGTAAISVVLAENASAAPIPTTLAPSILTTIGTTAATASLPTNTTLMTQGALTKMASVTWYVFEALLLIAWIDSMVSWVRRGCPFPRWVHLLSAGLFGAGVLTVALLGVWGILTPGLAAACLLIPPAAAYVGWLWMFGPEHAVG